MTQKDWHSSTVKRCPACNKLLNELSYGYFCKYCCKEWDMDGKFIPPLSAHNMKG